MAFNFNWSPLIADTDRVRDMLTSSLNKSPKPPIIVDSIIVDTLNLGSTPPNLEILEIGDLAEDRFRGIFKMSYAGDAFLTLKTKVQANPLKTWLDLRPGSVRDGMGSVGAGSGLTIPLQITLSDIRLSGFVILVFSKQKGITLVFRNDPLESLKVSSTFDSIPFVRDYLQRTIESQLRVLFMEDLPAIIHRLSLRMFSPEYQSPSDTEHVSREGVDAKVPIDPFASPPAQQASGGVLDEPAPFTLDAPTETYASFSQKNLLRLAALTESQRTLSLFTPSIRDTVYRAWASAADRNEIINGTSTPVNSAQRPATLSRIQSTLGSQGGWRSQPASASSQTSESVAAPSYATRPSLASMASTSTTYTLGSGASRSTRPRKRKKRIVNLRKNETAEGGEVSDAASLSSGYIDSAGRSASGSARPSVSGTEPTSTLPSCSAPREGEITTPPRSPKKKVGFQTAPSPADGTRLDPNATLRGRPVTPRNLVPSENKDVDRTPKQSMYLSEPLPPLRDESHHSQFRSRRQPLSRMQTLPTRPSQPPHLQRSSSEVSLQNLAPSAFGQQDGSGSTGGILEQAWMMKMATEIARKVAQEKEQQGQGVWRPDDDDGNSGGEAPPAYMPAPVSRL